MVFKKLERRRRKLENISVMIDKLLSTQPRPVKVIWEHIGKLEGMITRLPEEGGARLVDQFRNKAVFYWQQLELGSLYHHFWPPPNGNSFWTPAPLPFEVRPPLVGPCESIMTPYTGEQYATRRQEPPPNAEAIRATLKHAFASLAPVVSLESDLERMKELLMLVTKARALTMPHWKNVPLLSEIFSMAFEKLPVVQQKLYRQEYNRDKKWLRDLRNFIQDEIDYFSLESLGTGNSGDGGGGGRGAVAASGGAAKGSMCFYCKVRGHHLNKCPVLANTLCAKCFQFSHTEIRCRNEMLFIKLEDI